MRARDLMTTSVLSVAPDTPVQRVAQLLLDHGISAVPVVEDGRVVGIISEGDLVSRSAARQQSRRGWLVRFLAGGASATQEAARDIDTARLARDVMSAPVVTTSEQTEAGEVVALMSQHNIKRLPVVRGDRIVGIISRADLIRAVAQGLKGADGAVGDSDLGRALIGIDRTFSAVAQGGGKAGAGGGEARAEIPHVMTAADFRVSVGAFKERERRIRAEEQQRNAEKHKHEIEVVLGTHISEDVWRRMLLDARRAAENGEFELQLLRIPHEACSDNGRMILMSEAGWEASLRGEAAELWLRWKRELAPQGFHLTARVLDYPGGVPGDIGLFLGWH